MNESTSSNEPHDWPDLLLDQALRETVGGETPPDLSEAILNAADAGLSSPRNVDMNAPQSKTRRFGWIALSAAAAILLMVGVTTTLVTQNAWRRSQSLARGDAAAPQSHEDLQMMVEPRVVSETASVADEVVRTGSLKVKREAAELRQRETARVSRDRLASMPVANQPAAEFHYYAGADARVAGKQTDTLSRLRDRATVENTWGELLQGRLGGRPWPSEETEGIAFAEGRGPGAGGDQYDAIDENPFITARGEEAVSTFSIDVDTASYTNVRQFLNAGQLPPPDAVRLEEFINYFDYDYQNTLASPARASSDEAVVDPSASSARAESPGGTAPSPNPSPASGGGESSPFTAHIEVAACPWKPAHRLVRIGVQGRELEAEKRPLTNLVFLIDVSGSMNQPAKHALVIEGLKALSKQLGENDRVAIVVYASQEGLALPSVSGSDQETILTALNNLRAGGSTAGGAGIRLAYQVAEDHFIKGGANRVILCTDGDFNVGTTSTAELERLVAQKAKQTGVFLSVCGFGRGNLNDAMMETITNKGNGNYYYIDSLKEAEKVFVKGLTGTLVTIAKDVKIQVEFNPAKVAGYRLLGYENRMLRTQDFNDDKKDAGEIGAGHTVTALYEIVPAGEEVPAPPVDKLKYQQPATATPTAASDELLTLKMRYKKPDEDVSSKLEWPVADSDKQFAAATGDFQFASAVASFGMQLRGSQHVGDATLDAVLEIAESTKGADASGYRAEFVELVKKAKALRGK